MKEPEHIKEIHRIREKMAKHCGFDGGMIRRAELARRKRAPATKS